MATPYDEGGGPEGGPQGTTTSRKVLGIVLILIVLFGSSVAIYFSALIVGAFFSAFMPLTTNLPAAVQSQIGGIPTTAFLALDIFVGGVAIVAVVGILKVIFGI